MGEVCSSDFICLGSSESISTEGSSESLSSPPNPREVSVAPSQVEQVELANLHLVGVD